MDRDRQQHTPGRPGWCRSSAASCGNQPKRHWNHQCSSEPGCPLFRAGSELLARMKHRQQVLRTHMAWFGMWRHGWSAGAGCGYHTSPARRSKQHVTGLTPCRRHLALLHARQLIWWLSMWIRSGQHDHKLASQCHLRNRPGGRSPAPGDIICGHPFHTGFLQSAELQCRGARCARSIV